MGHNKDYDYFSKATVLKKYGLAVDNVGLWRSEAHLIDKYFAKNSKILDLGCGSGRTTINLFNMGYQNIVGVDLSREMIEQCKNIALDKELKIDFQQGDATNLKKFNDQQFDNCFFSFNGLMSIPTEALRLRAFKEIHRVMKTGGYFIFTAHNREQENFAWHWKEEEERWNKGTQNPQFEMFGDHFIVDENNLVNYIHFYSIPEVIERVKAANFEVVEILDRNAKFIENAIVNQFSNNTIFYILKKI